MMMVMDSSSVYLVMVMVKMMMMILNSSYGESPLEIWCALVRGLRGDPAADPEILFETRDGALQTRQL